MKVKNFLKIKKIPRLKLFIFYKFFSFSDPINILLQKFSNEYFLKLLELIGQSGRVDVLLALEPFIGKISNERFFLVFFKNNFLEN